MYYVEQFTDVLRGAIHVCITYSNSWLYYVDQFMDVLLRAIQVVLRGVIHAGRFLC